MVRLSSIDCATVELIMVPFEPKIIMMLIIGQVISRNQCLQIGACGVFVKMKVAESVFVEVCV